ncbi:hypothetical protein PHYPO_G00169100, partial [Pangasianodon hypophthalmus]
RRRRAAVSLVRKLAYHANHLYRNIFLIFHVIKFFFKNNWLQCMDSRCLKLCEDMQTDASGGGTWESLGDISPEDQHHGEFQKKPIKEEEPEDEEYFYGETSSFVRRFTPVDRQNEGFQEKHLKEEEPEDDEYLYCEDCSSFFINKCEVHGLAVFISDTPVPMGVPDRARQTLPPGLEVRKSEIPGAGLGVFNKGEIVPVGSHFGPYQGDLVEREEAMNSGYSWVICRRGHCEEYIDAKREICANWMRYVNCARNDEEQNLVGFQYRGEIFYRCSQPIKPGQELLVWYEEKYAKDLSVTFEYLWNKKCSTDGIVHTLIFYYFCLL